MVMLAGRCAPLDGERSFPNAVVQFHNHNLVNGITLPLRGQKQTIRQNLEVLSSGSPQI